MGENTPHQVLLSRQKNNLFSTNLNNLAKDLTEAHGEGVGLLLEQVAAGLRPFQPSLHDGLNPVGRHLTL